MLLTSIVAIAILLTILIVRRFRKKTKLTGARRSRREPQLLPRPLRGLAMTTPCNNDEDNIAAHRLSSSVDAPVIEMTVDSDESLGLKKNILSTKKIDSFPENKSPLDHIALQVMSEVNNPFAGYELLQSLLSAGLRFGDRQIFHRHETKTGRGKILFSVAAANKPGTFELSKMGSFTCPGLTFFMVLADHPDPSLGFETMLETAKQLAEDLKGEVWSSERRPLNLNMITQLRIRLKSLSEEKNSSEIDLFEIEH